MNNLFRSSKSSLTSSKNRGSTDAHSNSGSQSELGGTSIPYDRIAQSSGSTPGSGNVKKSSGHRNSDSFPTAASTRNIGPPLSNPELTTSTGEPAAQDTTIHDFFARTAGERADGVRMFSANAEVGEEGGSAYDGRSIRSNSAGSTISRVTATSGSKQGPGGPKLAVVREGSVSPTPSLANPYASSSAGVRRRDSDASMRSTNVEYSRYPTTVPRSGNNTITSRPSGSSTKNGNGIYRQDAGRSSSSVDLPETLTEEFDFPRPSDAVVEQMFQKVLGALDFPTDSKSLTKERSSHRASITSFSSPNALNQYNNLRNMSVDKKWMMVESDARAQWEAQRKQTNKPPKWYVMQLMHDNLTNQELKGLEIMLRTSKVHAIEGWVNEFIQEWQGLFMLASKLSSIHKRRVTQNDEQQLQTEILLLKCLYSLCNRGYRRVADNAINKPAILTGIMGSILSPNIQARKHAIDILTYFLYYNTPEGYDLVLRAFKSYEIGLDMHQKGINRFATWLKMFETTVSSRGMMGSLVGVGPELRKSAINAGVVNDAALADYALSNLFLINGLLTVRSKNLPSGTTGLNQRLHIRIELVQAGIESIFPKLQALNNDLIDQEIRLYKELLEDDVKEQKHRLNNDAIKNLGEGPEIFQGLMSRMAGTPAETHFLSILRHFTLIENQPEQRAKYYQLINQLVTAITLDGEMGTDKDFTAQAGVTVQTMFSRFETEANLDTAVQQIDELEKKLARTERRKAELEAELGESNGGLVGTLKTQLAQMEERLRVSRQNATSLEEDSEKLRQEALSTTKDLRLDVYEMIEMLIETERLDDIIQNPGRYRKDRVALVAKYEEQQERARTIRTLEGRNRKAKKLALGESGFESDSVASSDEDEGLDAQGAEDAEVCRADKVALGSGKRKNRVASTKPDGATVKRASGSQFVDADDANVKAHITERLLDEERSPHRAPRGSLPRSARSRNVNLDIMGSSSSTGSLLSPPAIGEKSRHRYPDSLAKQHSGYSNVVDELLRTRQMSRSISAPANMEVEDDEDSIISTLRESGFSMATARTAATSRTSQHSQKASGSGSTLAAQLTAKAKALGAVVGPDDDVKLPGHDSLSTVQEDDQDDEDAPPPPPPPPPMPSSLRGILSPADDDSAPPPPPPPPPLPPASMGLGIGGPGVPEGLLAGIASGIKLRKTDTDEDREEAPPPPAPMAPPPMFRRSSKRYSVAQGPHGERRKDVQFTATRKMKQLQWEKVNKSQLEKTVWGHIEEIPHEEEWARRLKKVDIWSEMEDEFKARDVVYDAVAKRQKEELKSVLDPSARKHVEILMNRNKRLEPEELCERILSFDKELCNNTFLSELNNLLPTPEQVSLLKQHSAETPEELALLHPADRLMLRLIKIPHLADRIKGMLYNVSFEETISLLEKGVNLLQDACHDLKNAKQFKALLNVILMMGNFMNGSNYGGGAYGFKIASINRLVDTKSSNGQNLLHFLEKTVTSQFPDIAEFRTELTKPAEAYRVSVEELSSGSRELRNGIQKIRRDLENRFLDPEDGYAKRMFPFSNDAEGRVEALLDQVKAGIRAFNEVKTYFGEGDSNYNAASNPLALGRPSSLEFFGIFKTFLTSYDLCRAQNKARDDAKAALDKRRQAEKSRQAALTPQVTGATNSEAMGAMDELHARLRMQGTPRAKRTDRRRARELEYPLTPSMDQFDMTNGFNDLNGDITGLNLADMAAKMLFQLEDGSPTPKRNMELPSATPLLMTLEGDAEIEKEDTKAEKVALPESPQASDATATTEDPASYKTPPSKSTTLDYSLDVNLDTQGLNISITPPETSPTPNQETAKGN